MTSSELPPIWTIGHSNHTLEELIELVRQHDVTLVADVRSAPYSKRLAHFGREQLAAGLKVAGIGYQFLGRELGARRTEPESFAGGQASYERVAALPSFQQGLQSLRERSGQRVAILCAEKEPLDCHRSVLICRHLRSEFEVLHILADGSTENHRDTEKRLVKELGIARTLFEPDLSEAAMIERAYEERGRQIAYRASEGDSWQP